MDATALLRRLAEQQDYVSLHAAGLELDSDQPAVQVLLALAEAQLGDAAGAYRRLAAVDRDTLDFEAQVDLAAVHVALGELDQAVTLLETSSPEPAPDNARQARARHHALLAGCRQQQGRHDEAQVLYERSLSLQPSIAAYQQLLLLQRDRGSIDRMARVLDAAWTFWSAQRSGWPPEQARVQSQQLRARQLDLLLVREPLEAAEAWVLDQRPDLDERDWCALIAALAERLAARNRPADAEEWLRIGLRHHPDHVLLYVQLAELAQLQGRPHQTIALLRRAITLADAQREPTATLWTRLSAAALHTSPALARHAAEQAHVQLGRLHGLRDPNEIALLSVQVELALAAVEAHEHDYGAAERRYRRLLEQRPRQVSALLGLGQLLLQLGRVDEAVALFDRVKAVDPARGYSALIVARRFPADEETLERLEGLARTPGFEGAVRAGLLFQLAAAWEQRGDWERAFALADEANAANRRLLRYDPAAHRRYCARIRHAFSKALYEHRADCGHESTLPVFVVGMPRSGTTLVEQILAGHSRIHGAGELGTIPRVIAGLERWERRTGSGRRYPDCVDDLDPAVVRGIAEAVLRELAEYAPGADHVVDKLPHNFENIGLIRLLFPRAKVISVRRDPRDVAISNYFTDYARKHAGMGFAYDLDWIGEQLADHNLLMQHWQRVWPEGILEIRYEDLVDDPERCARRMLAHLGVEWEPQVLNFAALERPVRTASLWQVRQPLYADARGRWQRYRHHLAPLLAATCRRISSDPIEMVTLPEPGWLNQGVDRYREGDLDGAEYRFKQLLHYLPEHAAARFMLGLVYLHKGHRRDGIALMEQAVERCPWNRHWQGDLARAYRLVGRDADADALTAHERRVPADAPAVRDAALPYLFLSGESTCSSFGSAAFGANA